MSPSSALPSPPDRAMQWLRLSASIVFLALCILVPFGLWGDAFDKAAPAWLSQTDHVVWLAAAGIALLVADVLLPIPSSVVGTALCWTLGPIWGGLCFALGLTLSFGFGYLLGRLAPEHRIRRWVGAALWDSAHQRAQQQALWWIVAARPLPLLSEMSALLAGVWRVPVGPAMLMATLSSCGVAALYAASAWLGLNAPGTAVTLLATMTLPALTWLVHRLVVRRLQSRGGGQAGSGVAACLLALGMLLGASGESNAQDASARPGKTMSEIHTYYTGGVHNDKGCLPPKNCVHKRKKGEPGDPLFPKWWTSDWTMYRVFNNYEKYPPPYASPPAGLTANDYQVSYGSTYYDSTYMPADKDGTGAMMEHYDKFCLPIFPMANNFTCSFISLGNKAYFLRYDDRLQGTPECCQFSLHNHAPRRDLIKHLPYNKQQSTHLNGSIQAYSREVGPHKVLFGYSFNKTATSDDPGNPKAPRYRHPQSFFFSGYPADPPKAPIVSQNYTNFRADKPDPAKTWGQVARVCTPNPGWCCLFQGDCTDNKARTGAALGQSTAAPTTWADMNSPAK